jgi:hypothetical protein
VRRVAALSNAPLARRWANLSAMPATSRRIAALTAGRSTSAPTPPAALSSTPRLSSRAPISLTDTPC